MLFFRKVVLRRVAHFLWVYVVLIYIFSALFSAQIQLRELQTLEYDLRGSTSDRRGPGGMTLEQYDEFIRGRLAAVSRERGYDKPFLLRVHALSLRVLRFDFGTTLLANPIYFPSGKNVMSDRRGVRDPYRRIVRRRLPHPDASRGSPRPLQCISPWALA